MHCFCYPHLLSLINSFCSCFPEMLIHFQRRLSVSYRQMFPVQCSKLSRASAGATWWHAPCGTWTSWHGSCTALLQCSADGSTSAVCSRSGGWRRCGTGWWWASAGCSWCHAGCRSSPPWSPPPWCSSCWSPTARRRLPSIQCACCASTAAPASPPAASHLGRLRTVDTVSVSPAEPDC